MANKRAYFRKGIHAKLHPRIRKSRPVHQGLVQIITRDGQSRMMASNEAARQLGRSKGGRVAHERGTRYCWTPEQARAAANKLWRTRWRMNKRIGTRLGRPSKYRPRLNRVVLRQYYANNPTLGITFNNSEQSWFVNGLRISERTALTRLGHKPPPRKRGLVPISDGIPIAPETYHKSR